MPGSIRSVTAMAQTTGVTDLEGTLAGAWEPEQITVVRGARTGVPIIVAVHSTVLGPAIGGCRFRHSPSWQDGLHRRARPLGRDDRQVQPGRPGPRWRQDSGGPAARPGRPGVASRPCARHIRCGGVLHRQIPHRTRYRHRAGRHADHLSTNRLRLLPCSRPCSPTPSTSSVAGHWPGGESHP